MAAEFGAESFGHEPFEHRCDRSRGASFDGIAQVGADPFLGDPEGPRVSSFVEVEVDRRVDQNSVALPSLGAPDDLAAIDDQGIGRLVLETDRGPVSTDWFGLIENSRLSAGGVECWHQDFEKPPVEPCDLPCPVMVPRQEEGDGKVPAVHDAGTAAHAAKHRDAVVPAPLDVDVFGFLSVPQDDDWSGPGVAEQRRSARSGGFEEIVFESEIPGGKAVEIGEDVENRSVGGCHDG